jgi:hypothetical protein
MASLKIKDLLRCGRGNGPSIGGYIIDLGIQKTDPASFSEK